MDRYIGIGNWSSVNVSIPTKSILSKIIEIHSQKFRNNEELISFLISEASKQDQELLKIIENYKKTLENGKEKTASPRRS